MSIYPIRWCEKVSYVHFGFYCFGPEFYYFVIQYKVVLFCNFNLFVFLFNDSDPDFILHFEGSRF